MKKLTLLLLIFGCLPQSADAEEKKLPLSYCTPAQNIQARIEACEDNDAYIKEGDNCLTKLENEVKIASKAMTAGFSDNLSQKQDKKFNSSLQDNTVSSVTLAYLIALTDVAAKDVAKYKDSVAAPEDADEPEVNEGNPEAYSMSIDCYGDTKKSLDGVIADINHVKKELLAAKAITDANATTSGAREQGVQGSSVQPLIKGTAKAAPTPVTGTPKNRDSDVSGTEEAKKKRENEQKK